MAWLSAPPPLPVPSLHQLGVGDTVRALNGPGGSALLHADHLDRDLALALELCGGTEVRAGVFEGTSCVVWACVCGFSCDINAWCVEQCGCVCLVRGGGAGDCLWHSAVRVTFGVLVRLYCPLESPDFALRQRCVLTFRFCAVRASGRHRQCTLHARVRGLPCPRRSWGLDRGCP